MKVQLRTSKPDASLFSKLSSYLKKVIILKVFIAMQYLSKQGKR